MENSPPGIQTIPGGAEFGGVAVLGMVGSKCAVGDVEDMLGAVALAVEALPEVAAPEAEVALDTIGAGRLRIAKLAAPARMTTRMMIHRDVRRERTSLRCFFAGFCAVTADLAWCYERLRKQTEHQSPPASQLK